MLPHSAESRSLDTVSKCHPDEVNVGDTIWAQNDNDWFRVARVDENQWGPVFFRADGSLAEFSEDATILRREGEITVVRSEP